MALSGMVNPDPAAALLGFLLSGLLGHFLDSLLDDFLNRFLRWFFLGYWHCYHLLKGILKKRRHESHANDFDDAQEFVKGKIITTDIFFGPIMHVT